MVKKQMQINPTVNKISQHLGEVTPHQDPVHGIPELVKHVHQTLHCDHWSCVIGLNDEGTSMIPYSTL